MAAACTCSPAEFDALPFWDAVYLGEAIAEREKAKVDLQVALAKAGVNATIVAAGGRPVP